MRACVCINMRERARECVYDVVDISCFVQYDVVDISCFVQSDFLQSTSDNRHFFVFLFVFCCWFVCLLLVMLPQMHA